jgi:hypothetical protein
MNIVEVRAKWYKDEEEGREEGWVGLARRRWSSR